MTEYFQSQYIFFIVFFIVAFMYKFLFWMYVIQLKEYRTDRFKEYIGTPQGKSAFFNFWFVLEFSLIVLSLALLIDSKLEILFFQMFFYFLIFEFIFVIGKIIRRRILVPKITPRLIMSSVGVIFMFAISIHVILIPPSNIFPYIIILGSFIAMPLLIFLSIALTLPIVNSQKKKKIQKAQEKSKIIDKPIKVGITGSYGKSSVKQYLGQILSSQYNVLTTPDNINSELGVADVVQRRLSNDYDYFVAEMGAYKVGEISILGDIVHHKYGFLTAIGNQHLALFGGIENTKVGKFQIAESPIKNGGKVYINYDNLHIREYIESYTGDTSVFIKYGINNTDVDIKGQIHNIVDGFTEFSVYKDEEKYDFKTNLLGSHNVLNLTGILGFCIDMKCDMKEISKELCKLEVPKSTLEITKRGLSILIDDTYNLSEDGLYAGLDVANSFGKNKKITLILDDILELGKTAEEKHEQIAANIVKNYTVESICYVGKNYKKYFLKGLTDAGYGGEIAFPVELYPEREQVFLFEGRGAKKLFTKITHTDA